MTKIAYVVGINKYCISELTGCVNDATDLAKLLDKNEDGSSNFAVRLETNIMERAKLKKLIIDLFSRDDDTVLFYFSGHGIMNSEGMAYILTDDYEEHNEGISMDEILYLANKSKARNKIIILDCCHGGALGAPMMLGGLSSNIAEGVSILTSSRDNQTSVEVDGHGIFTNLLLESLRGGAADIQGNITLGGIYAYIDRAMGPLQQRPVFKTNTTRFTPVRNVLASVPVELLRNLVNYFPTSKDAHELDSSYEWTNDPNVKPLLKEPYADPNNVRIFKELQAMVKVGLIVPNNKKDMYWEAMEGGTCSLTPLGQHYWQLVKGGL